MVQFSFKQDLPYLLFSPALSEVADKKDRLLSDLARIQRENPQLIQNSYTNIEEVEKDLRGVLGPIGVKRSPLFSRVEAFFTQVEEGLSPVDHPEDRLYRLNPNASLSLDDSAQSVYMDFQEEWVWEPVLEPADAGLLVFSEEPDVTIYDSSLNGEILPYDFDPLEREELEQYRGLLAQLSPDSDKLLMDFLKSAAITGFSSNDALLMLNLFAEDVGGISRLLLQKTPDQMEDFINQVADLDSEDLDLVLPLGSEVLWDCMELKMEGTEIVDFSLWHSDWTVALEDHPSFIADWDTADLVSLTRLSFPAGDALSYLASWQSVMEDPSFLTAEGAVCLLSGLSGLSEAEAAKKAELIGDFVSRLWTEDVDWAFSLPPEEFRMMLSVQAQFEMEELRQISEAGHLSYLVGLKQRELVAVLKQCVNPEFISEQKQKFAHFTGDLPENPKKAYLTLQESVDRFLPGIVSDFPKLAGNPPTASDILGIMMIESGGNPRAHNPNGNSENREGYHGLMQLGMNEFTSSNRPKISGSSDPYNPNANIYAGTRYVCRCLTNQNNPTLSWALAIGNYNWGCGNVSSYQKAGSKTRPSAITIDYIAAFLLYRSWFAEAGGLVS